jgi:hypothetical protein
MPQYGPPTAISSGGITVDAQGFVTIPGDSNAVAFKFQREAIAGGPPHRYKIVVLDVGAKTIYNAEQ